MNIGTEIANVLITVVEIAATACALGFGFGLIIGIVLGVELS